MTERTSAIPTQSRQRQHPGPLTRGDLDAAAKRLFDLLVSALGLLLLSPLFAWLAWRIKRDSPGPVFYRGPRYGRGGRVFQILKFRTMYERPGSYAGPRVTAQDDPRITPLGKWLRDTKLNELPQLWNVLRGEMSLVGPRPEDPELGKSWPLDVRREILSVRPGITSPASVQYRDEEGMLDSEQVMHTYMEYIVPSKLRLDQLYVRYRSFWLDLDVLFWTALVLLPLVKRYQPPERHLLLGPLTRLMRRFLNWFALDALVSLLAMSVAMLFWRTLGPLNVGWQTALAFTLGFALLFSLSGLALGANKVQWSKAAAADVLELIPPLALAGSLALAANAWLHPAVRAGVPTPKALFHPGLVIMATGLAALGFVAVRYRTRLISGAAARWLRSRQEGVKLARERVLIVGGGQSGQFAAWLLQQRRESNRLHLVGYVDDDLYKQGARMRGLEVVGRREDLLQVVRRQDVGVILFAIHNISPAERAELLELCRKSGARTILIPDVYRSLAQALDAEAPGERLDILPERLSQAALGAEELTSWLAALDESARQGDLQAVRRAIRELQEQC